MIVHLQAVLFFVCLLGGALSFPDSDSPITEEPPLARPNTKEHCLMTLFDEAACDGWNKVRSLLLYVGLDDRWITRWKNSRIVLFHIKTTRQAIHVI
jgi:hypothetical protein